MVRMGPFSDRGGMMTLTREPSFDAAPDGGHDPVDHPPELFFALELGGGQGQLSFVLDEDLIRPVDHDLGDRRVGDERLDRPEPEEVVEHRVQQPLLLRLRERQTHLRYHRVERIGDAGRPLLPVFIFALVDVLDQPRLQPVLDAFGLDLEGGPHARRRRTLAGPLGAARLWDVGALGQRRRIGALLFLDAIEE